MLQKQQRSIDPLYGPVVYTEHFYGAGRSDAPPPIVVEGRAYLPYKRFDEPSTGLSGSVLLDESTGHALILFKGMDRLFVDGGLGGMLTDIHAILQSKFGSSNDQFAGAEQAYVEALCDPRIESIETIGYSLGSEFSNYLAVRYGAMGVVFGDMGIGKGTLDRYGIDTGKTALTREQLRRNVTSLTLGGDLLVKVFGPGTVIGQVMELPGGLAGVFHQPEIYESAAKSMLQDRQKKDTAVAQKVAAPSAGWGAGATTAFHTTP